MLANQTDPYAFALTNWCYIFFADPKLKKWLSKFALINFVLLAWLLEKLYSASLTSMLTVRQLQPTVADLNQLIRNGDYIGYQTGSFVKDLLKSLNADERKIRSYGTHQYAEALMKGSWNGGVSAIFDEIPYLKLFMSKHCSNHSIIGRVYKTGGFGFVSYNQLLLSIHCNVFSS
jgi:ionotropic glutamate receptor